MPAAFVFFLTLLQLHLEEGAVDESVDVRRALCNSEPYTKGGQL